MLRKLNDFINAKIIYIFTMFLFLQPFLDAITGILFQYNMISNISLGIRLLFFIFALYYIIFIKKDKQKYFLSIFIYSILFILINILFKENTDIMYETKALIKNIFLPTAIVFILDVFKNNDFDEKKLYSILIIYLLLIIIPNTLNIGFNSYSHSKLGSVGFFQSANAIGSIISIISPLYIAYLICKKNKTLLFVFLGIYIYTLLNLGTKAPLLCMFIVLLYYLLLFIIKLIKKRKYIYLISSGIVLLILILIVIKILPSTPFYKNLIIHLDFLNITSFSDLLSFKNIDHFIFSSRLSEFKNTFSIFLNSSILQKIFGIGYIINGQAIKTAEMDYLVMFVHQGILGFILIYYIYFDSILIILKKYLKKFKSNFINIKRTSLILSLLISILCALLAGHVLETPSVSIFVALLIGICYKEFCMID